MEFPDVYAFEASDSEEDAAGDLARHLQARGTTTPFIINSRHGSLLAGALTGVRPRVTPPPGATQQWAAELGSTIHRSGADAVVAIGGGRLLDLAKLAAARAGLTVITVPTQLSHDGICSPVAVVPDEAGTAESLGAIAPRLVYLSIPTLMGATVASIRAGLGDLIANPLALRDWTLAAARGLASVDQRAWDLSVESFELIKPHLTDDPAVVAKDPVFVRRLGDALVLSGMSMIASGNSRPASGGEHEISHALDLLFGSPAMHGAQVAFGCIFSAALHGEDVVPFRRQLARLGLPQHPGDLGLNEDDVVRLLLAAPDTRPGRFTVLEEADLDEQGASNLVKRIWGAF
jgi:glycerol-1-phosphate dehydrogenase [NAD(P)+]